MTDSNESIIKRSEKILSTNEKNLILTTGTSLLGKLKGFTSDEALLIDTSGSMSEYANATQSRFQVVTETLKSLEEYRRFNFSGSCIEETQKPLTFQRGGTNLAEAFRFVKEKGIKHIILLTDGWPDSEFSALTEAKGLNIDIIYIGPDPVPPFLAELAKVSNGSFMNPKNISPSLLRSVVKGFLK